MSKTKQTIDQLFEKIASTNLHIETLNTRNSDSLDFHNVSVWSLKDALNEAYEAGKNERITRHISG